MTVAVTRLQINLLKAVEPGASSTYLSRKSRRGFPSFSGIHGNRNRAYAVEITTTTTEHRDYPPTSDFFQLRSIGEPRRQDLEANTSPRRSTSRSRSRPRHLKTGSRSDEAKDVEMRAVLNSRGRVILKEVDTRELARWEKVKSRERLV